MDFMVCERSNSCFEKGGSDYLGQVTSVQHDLGRHYRLYRVRAASIIHGTSR